MVLIRRGVLAIRQQPINNLITVHQMAAHQVEREKHIHSNLSIKLNLKNIERKV
jgi:hypothetical protein